MSAQFKLGFAPGPRGWPNVPLPEGVSVIPGNGPLFFSPWLLLLVNFLGPGFYSLECQDLETDMGILKGAIVNLGENFSTTTHRDLKGFLCLGSPFSLQSNESRDRFASSCGGSHW